MYHDDHKIRRMEPGDAEACARLQMRLIPGTLINLAGLPFIRDVYFEGISESSLCSAYVATHDGEVVGFCAYTSHYERFASALKKTRLWSAACALGKRVLCHPLAVMRFLLFTVTRRPDVHAEAEAEGLTQALHEDHRSAGTAFVLQQACLTDLDATFEGLVKCQCWQKDANVQRFHEVLGFGDPIDFKFMGNSYTMLVRRCPLRPGTSGKETIASSGLASS